MAKKKYARSSFFRGMGSVLDLFGLFGGYRAARDDRDADARAIHSDFKAIGMDLTEAMARYESEQRSRSPQSGSGT